MPYSINYINEYIACLHADVTCFPSPANTNNTAKSFAVGNPFDAPYETNSQRLEFEDRTAKDETQTASPTP